MRARPWVRLIVLFVVFALWLPVTVHVQAQSEPPTIRYAVPDPSSPGNNCGSWGTACTLQGALAAAGPGDEVWVQEGVYTPAPLPPVNRSASFHLKSGVAVYGGFAGTEDTRDERDVAAHPAILSGDLLNNDNGQCSGTECTNPLADNSYHVADASQTDSTAVLDGFTIQGGYADGGTNSTLAGGGLVAWPGSPTLVNITFERNYANRGGGMASISESNSPPNSPTLRNVIFRGNTATDGGGMYNGNSASDLTNVLFVANRAASGGAICNSDGGNPTLTNVTMAGNAADYGGGICNFESNPSLRNCIVWGNYISGTSTPNQVDNPTGSSPTIAYSLVQGSYEGGNWDAALGTDGGGNIDVNPLFIRSPGPGPDNTWDTGDLRLQPGSPAIDAGDSNALPWDVTTDLAGGPRIVGSTVDMGAYEAPETDDPGNYAWTRALPLDLSPSGSGSASQYLARKGQSRWYKFRVSPGSTVILTLTNLPANYDLTLYKDIAATYESITGEGLSVEDLARLDAEYAPDMFSPDMFSPDMFSPDMFSPDMFSPDMFSPDMFSPDMFSPDMFSPDMFSPDMFSPDMFSPDMFSPDMFSPDMFSPDMFSPEAKAYASAQVRSLIGFSAFPGTVSEGLYANTWNNAGDYYVRVRGRNGAYSLEQPFDLSVTVLTGDCGSDIDPGLTGTTPPKVYNPKGLGTGEVKAVILTDLQRLGVGPEDALLAKLEELAEAVDGVVVDVGPAGSTVEALQGQADDHIQCPWAKNLVAAAIRQILAGYCQANPVEYVVIVGNDDVIPFFRYPDTAGLGPESGYVPPVRDSTTSQASLRLNYVLSQDAYGSPFSISYKAGSLPMPGLAVGRLVETPDEITTMIDAYLTSGGVVTPSSALVTGYDFLADAAEAVQAELAAGLGDADAVDSLIAARDVSPEAGWTADEMREAFLGQRHDVSFLAGHFSASSALAADSSTHMLASDVLATTVDMENALVFSAGCHSGYNIVNDHDVTGITQEPDWAQALAGRGATLIGGTGYQYGDTDFLEYSEQLYLAFAQQLRAGTGPVPIGKALVAAKRAYLASTPEMQGIHEKAFLEATLFGLPMLSINMPSGRGASDAEPSLVGSTSSFTSNPGDALGLHYADVQLEGATLPMLPLQTKELDTLSDPVTASYAPGSDGVVVRPAQPVLPLERYNVSAPAGALRGVGFRGGDYADTEGILPLTGAPATEIRGVHTPFYSEVFYPVRPWAVNYFGALAGGATRLAVIPAQYKSAAPLSETGTLRRYSTMDYRLYYSNNVDTYGENTPALAASPSIVDVHATASSDGSSVEFTATVVGDPSAGIQEVWVTYTAVDGAMYGQWQSLDLNQETDSRVWVGSLPLNGTPADQIRYMVQAVNGVGKVTMLTNLGAYYVPGVDPAGTPSGTEEATTLTLASPSSGAFGTPVTFTATLKDSDDLAIQDQMVVFALGTQRRLATTDASGQAQVSMLLLARPGDYKPRAIFAGSDDYLASTAEGALTILKRDSSLALEHPAGGGLVATLADVGGRPLSGKLIRFEVKDAGTAVYEVAAITDYAGQAVVAKLPAPPLVAGQSYDVGAEFGGNAFYNGTSGTTSATFEQDSLASVSAIYDGDAVIPVGSDLNLHAAVTAPGCEPSACATPPMVLFRVSGGSAQTVGYRGVSATDGVATATLGPMNTTGVYRVEVIVIGEWGSWPAAVAFVAVYDPSAGFVTGGGWIKSPAGAYTADPTLEGRATFAFVSKYQKGADVPSGQTQFRFKAAELDFRSTSYDWLLVAGAQAKLKGSGTINGTGNYGFMISAVDESLTPSTDVDLFRIKIWNKGTDEVIYDNQMNAAEDAAPTTAIGGGNIVIHAGQ